LPPGVAGLVAAVLLGGVLCGIFLVLANLLGGALLGLLVGGLRGL